MSKAKQRRKKEYRHKKKDVHYFAAQETTAWAVTLCGLRFKRRIPQYTLNTRTAWVWGKQEWISLKRGPFTINNARATCGDCMHRQYLIELAETEL